MGLRKGDLGPSVLRVYARPGMSGSLRSQSKTSVQEE